MFRRKSRKKTRRLPAFLDQLAAAGAPGLRPVLGAVGWVVAVAAIVVGWALGVPRLERYASAGTTPGALEVAFVDPPAWMHGDLETHLVLTAAQHVDADPLQRDGLAAARSSLMATGWFTEVAQVRRTGPHRVTIEATFVEPYAVIRDGEGDHLVSPKGRLLPRSVPVGHASAFTVIHGARYRRPERPGEAWPGADVTAALRLLRLIDAKPWRDQVAGIDVAGFEPDQQLRLITDRNHRIIWGRPPGEETAGEVSTERKLYYLDYPFEHFGHIDGGYDGDLDITDPRGVFGR